MVRKTAQHGERQAKAMPYALGRADFQRENRQPIDGAIKVSFRTRMLRAAFRLWPSALVVMAACVTALQMPEMTARWWHGPVLAWAVASGIFGVGGVSASALIHAFGLIPDTTTAVVIGLVIGFVARKRPIHLAMLYGLVYSGLTYILLSRIMSVWDKCFNLVLALIPAMVAQLVRLFFGTRVRPAAMSCVRCGYDMTGNVSGICPECGTPLQERRENVSAR